MSCGCNEWPPSGNMTPQANPWGASPGDPIPAVYDPVSGQLRPLGFGENLGNSNCNPCNEIQGVLPSSKVMQDAYFDLQRRLVLLEQKYCQCVCDGAVVPGPTPVGQDTYVVSSRFFNGELCLTLNNGAMICAGIPIPQVAPEIHVESLVVTGQVLCAHFNNGTQRCVQLPAPAEDTPDSAQSDLIVFEVQGNN